MDKETVCGEQSPVLTPKITRPTSPLTMGTILKVKRLVLGQGANSILLAFKYVYSGANTY